MYFIIFIVIVSTVHCILSPGDLQEPTMGFKSTVCLVFVFIYFFFPLWVSKVSAIYSECCSYVLTIISKLTVIWRNSGNYRQSRLHRVKGINVTEIEKHVIELLGKNGSLKAVDTIGNYSK